jgi:HAD superfamily hydrolase (TIGR01549 family)
MIKRLMLFDLDGVLLDSKDNMRKSWAHVLERTNLKIPFEDYFSRIGRPFRDIMIDLGVSYDLEKIEKIYMTASFDFLEEALFFPNVEDTLNQLHHSGIKLGIVTSKDKFRTNAVLQQIDTPFVTIQSPSERYRGKPAPDYLMIAMAEAGEDPSDTLYIGDMKTDYEAARRAGIDYVHASWGYGESIKLVDSIRNISDLLRYIL